MGSSSLVIICSLALLGAVTAEICVTKAKGSSGIPVEALRQVYPHGGTVQIPPVCSLPKGLAVTVCVKGGEPPIVEILNIYQVQVITSQPFSIHAIMHCRALQGQSESDGLLRGTGHGFEIGAMDILENNGRDILIPNQFIA